MSNKKNNQFINIIVNIVIPVIILTKFSKAGYLGPVLGLFIALLFPLIYGLYEFIFLKQKNFISIIGFIGILLTGTIGLMQFPPRWIAIKEASVPLAIGIVVLVSTRTQWQVIKKFIYHRELFDIDLIESKLSTSVLQNKLNSILTRANVFLAFSFFFSATLNYFLAKIIVRSMPGTAQFNEEVGKMTALSFPVIGLPSVIFVMVIFWYLMSTLKGLTGLSSDEMFSKKIKDKT